MPDPTRWRGGTFKDLPEGTGFPRHHLFPQECLKEVGRRLGIRVDPDYGPAILIDPYDHELTASWGPARLKGMALWTVLRRDQLVLDMDQVRPIEKPERDDEESPEAPKGKATRYNPMRPPPGMMPEERKKRLEADERRDRGQGWWPGRGRDDQDRGIGD